MSEGNVTRPFALPADWLDEETPEPTTLAPGFLLLLTLLAAALRFFELTGQSLWVDELFTWQAVRPGIGLSFGEQMLDTIQGPLYHAVVWPLLRLADSAFMLRLPSAVLGTLTVPLFAVLVARIFDARSARLAGLLLALSPFHIWYSQEGRGYAFLIFFSVASAVVFLQMYRRRPTPVAALWFGLLATGAVWSNMGGLFLGLGFGATVLLLDPPRTRAAWLGWGLGFGLILLLSLPWVLKASGIWAVERIMPGVGTGDALRGETTFSLMALPYTIFTFFYGYSLGPSLRELHQPDQLAVLRGHAPLLALAVVPVGVSLLSGLVRLGRKRLYLLLWILVPMVVLILLAVRNVKPWNPRYVAMTLPWLLAMSGFGLARLPRRIGLVCTSLLLILSCGSLVGHYFDADYAKADVRAATKFVAAENQDVSPVLVPAVSSVFDYYAANTAQIMPAYGLQLATAAEAETFIAAQLHGYDACWLVQARQWYYDPGDHLPTALTRAGHLRLEFTAAGVRIYSWRRFTVGMEVQPTR